MTYEEMIEDETFIEEMQTRIMSDQEMDTMYIPDVQTRFCCGYCAIS